MSSTRTFKVKLNLPMYIYRHKNCIQRMSYIYRLKEDWVNTVPFDQFIEKLGQNYFLYIYICFTMGYSFVWERKTLILYIYICFTTDCLEHEIIKSWIRLWVLTRWYVDVILISTWADEQIVSRSSRFVSGGFVFPMDIHMTT